MFQNFEALKIKQIAAVVPDNSEGEELWQLHFKKGWQKQLTEQTGIHSLRKSRLSTLDLGLAACRFLYPLGEQPQAIISVTQTPAQQIPGNAAGLAVGMGWTASKGRAAAPLCWDLSMGCAGLIWGLYQTALVLQQPDITEVLLVCAETHSRILDPYDRATRLLFGDGATAMRICKGSEANSWQFYLGSVPDAANQLCTTPEGHLQMDGLGIFNFAVSEVAPAIQTFLTRNAIDKSDISRYLFHQASHFVLKYLQRMLQIPEEKMPLALDGFGNTASASIGILLAHHFNGNSHPELKNSLIAGFGSGLQWGIVKADLSETEIFPIHFLREGSALSH